MGVPIEESPPFRSRKRVTIRLVPICLRVYWMTENHQELMKICCYLSQCTPPLKVATVSSRFGAEYVVVAAHWLTYKSRVTVEGVSSQAAHAPPPNAQPNFDLLWTVPWRSGHLCVFPPVPATLHALVHSGKNALLVRFQMFLVTAAFDVVLSNPGPKSGPGGLIFVSRS